MENPFLGDPFREEDANVEDVEDASDLNPYTIMEGYELEDASHIQSTPGSLGEVLQALEEDHRFLLEGGVFTEDVIETWISYKRERELEPVALRPHPYEFFLYSDI